MWQNLRASLITSPSYCFTGYSQTDGSPLKVTTLGINLPIHFGNKFTTHETRFCQFPSVHIVLGMGHDFELENQATKYRHLPKNKLIAPQPGSIPHSDNAAAFGAPYQGFAVAAESDGIDSS